jgi:hypothetical protein
MLPIIYACQTGVLSCAGGQGVERGTSPFDVEACRTFVWIDNYHCQPHFSKSITVGTLISELRRGQFYSIDEVICFKNRRLPEARMAQG